MFVNILIEISYFPWIYLVVSCIVNNINKGFFSVIVIFDLENNHRRKAGHSRLISTIFSSSMLRFILYSFQPFFIFICIPLFLLFPIYSFHLVFPESTGFYIILDIIDYIVYRFLTTYRLWFPMLRFVHDNIKLYNAR